MEYNEELDGTATIIPTFGKDLTRAKELAERAYKEAKDMIPDIDISKFNFIWQDFDCKVTDLIDDPN